MHSYLCSKVGDFDKPSDSVIYGKSPTNKIERWWRDLHERLEKYFKEQLSNLLNSCRYNPNDIDDRKMLAFIYIPVIQRECDIFVQYWNTHRIREQKGLELPVGIPDHMFNFPEKYAGKKDGFALQREHLQEVAEVSGILDTPVKYIDDESKQR